ncbi:MAG: aspartate aminotransferase family protein [Deltaproteobacteria bacterium]|nr:aspartate aminotransferase family protein [Deltaproteobacteria bacterium]
MTSNKEIKARHDKVMFPSTATFYQEAVALKEGKGARVSDWDGVTYLDFFGGILTVSLGQANERVNAKVKAQVDRLSHTSTLYPNLSMVELAEKLVGIMPGTQAERAASAASEGGRPDSLRPGTARLDKVFFCASGTEADETAVMIAQAFTGKMELIALKHGYSGRSLLAQSLTAHAAYRAVPTQIAGIKHAAAPYCYRCPFGKKPESCSLECAKDVEDVIQTTTTGQIAGMLAEPIMGVGGFITPPKDYFKLVYDIVKKYGGVFIADEVQSGFGRTGSKWWGIEQYGVQPDVMTMAKGIANGFPLSATIATTEIAASIAKKGTISTFGGNPISCAAAMGVIEEIEEKKLLENCAKRGSELREGLEGLKRQFPKVIGDVRGMGLMQALELVVDEAGGDRTPNPQAVGQLFEETKKRKLLIGKGGLKGNVVRISPPLNVTAAEVKEAVGILEQSFAAFARA